MLVVLFSPAVVTADDNNVNVDVNFAFLMHYLLWKLYGNFKNSPYHSEFIIYINKRHELHYCGYKK
jgi:hypothetical protein